MPHTLKCHVCSRELSVSDKVFEERISGKKVSVRCKHCNAPLTKEDADQDGKATSACAAATSSAGQTLPDAKQTPETLRTASPSPAAKPAAPQRKANPSTATLAAVAMPVTTASTTRPQKPSLVVGHTAASKPSLTTVTVPPRPRQEEPQLSRDGSATQTTVQEPAIILSAAEQPSNTVVVHASPRITASQLLVPSAAADDIAEISVVTPLPTEPPSPAEPIAPMPIFTVELDTATEESPVAAETSSPQAPTAPGRTDCAESSPTSVGSPLLAESRQSDHEVTPPAMTLAPDLALLRPSQPEVSSVATALFSKQKGTRWMVFGSASALLVIALTYGPGIFRKVPSSETASPTRLTAAASTGAVVAPPSEQKSPAAAASTEAVAATPSEQTSPAASPSSLAMPDSATASATKDDAIPDYVSKNTLELVADVALRRAQRCHPLGHAAGTSRVFVTLAPNGRVNDARIEGEPLASAPVASCILGHARAIQIPPFKGAAFTYVRSITLR